jgi:hypothetical protein
MKPRGKGMNGKGIKLKTSWLSREFMATASHSSKRNWTVDVIGSLDEKPERTNANVAVTISVALFLAISHGLGDTITL